MAFFGGGLFDHSFDHARSVMHRHMSEMDSMMGALMADPFEEMMFPRFGFPHPHPRMMMIGDGRFDPGGNRRLQQPPHLPAYPQQRQQVMPFGDHLLGGMFGRMENIFRQFDDIRGQAMANPDGHAYTHSQVISFNNLGDAPQVYEETATTRKVGQAAETRRTVRDSRTGVEAMTIGHKLGDKEHVIKKKRVAGGPIEQQQDFVNLAEEDAVNFDQEFARATAAGSSRSHHSNNNRLGHRHHRHHGAPAIESATGRGSREDRASPYRRTGPSSSGGESSGNYKGPIIEEVE